MESFDREMSEVLLTHRCKSLDELILKLWGLEYSCENLQLLYEEKKYLCLHYRSLSRMICSVFCVLTDWMIYLSEEVACRMKNEPVQEGQKSGLFGSEDDKKAAPEVVKDASNSSKPAKKFYFK